MNDGEVIWRQFATAFGGSRGADIVAGDSASPEGSRSDLFRMQSTEPGRLLSLDSGREPGRARQSGIQEVRVSVSH